MYIELIIWKANKVVTRVSRELTLNVCRLGIIGHIVTVSSSNTGSTQRIMERLGYLEVIEEVLSDSRKFQIFCRNLMPVNRGKVHQIHTAIRRFCVFRWTRRKRSFRQDLKGVSISPAAQRGRYERRGRVAH